ncbi:MAG: ABA4-like family protein [Microthrixaceae bacterium]
MTTAFPDDQIEAMPEVGERQHMSAEQKLAFRVVSASTVPVWAAMILFPNARLTERLVRLATPLYAVLGVAYVGFLTTEVATGEGGMPSFDDPEALRDALGSPTAFLAGWTHYIVFDLFVGRHIWTEARARGRNDRLALLLTWMVGPAGLTLHLARNAISRNPSPEEVS